MSQQFNVAVIGATGATGQAILDYLAQREFAVGQLVVVDTTGSEEEQIRFNGKSVALTALDDVQWDELHLAFFAAGSDIAGQWAPQAAQAGCMVIDNSAQFRLDGSVPLVVAEVNPHALADARERNIVASPNCITTQLLVALQPLLQAAGLNALNVSTYQSVSGSGAEGVSELAGQTAHLLNGRPVEPKLYAQQIAFNLIAQIGALDAQGYSSEEMSLVLESQKILADSQLAINATCVRVPVFYGHGMAVSVELAQPMDAEQAKALLRDAPGVRLCADEACPSPVADAVGCDEVLVGRVRQDLTSAYGLNLWLMADNVRKGLALNSVQIAEILVRDYW
ncbi:MAG: aspartate-semialdehyde dehydrogenase [Aeromonas sp.]